MTGSNRNFEKLNFTPKSSVFCFSQGQTSKYDRLAQVKSLPNQSKRLQEQREWMRSYEQLKAWEEIVISSDDEEALLEQITVPRTPVSGTSKAKNTR